MKCSEAGKLKSHICQVCGGYSCADVGQKSMLVPREPTQRQLEAMSAYSDDLSKYRAAMDAAPEIKVDMGPVAFDDYPDYHAESMGCGLEDRGIRDRYEAMAYGWDNAIERVAECIPEFHTAEQVAALQAENERLGNGWYSANVAALEAQAERDELLSTLNQVMQAVRSSTRPGDTVAKMEKQLSDIVVARDRANAALAKHEGEKHE